MKSLLTLLLGLVMCSIISFGSPLDHSTWNKLLTTYVTDDGKVNYSGFKNDQSKLDAYLLLLGSNVPDDSWTENEKLAFWINAYNAFTIKLIIDHYLVKSIMDIKNAWDIEFIQLGKKTYSLNEIEHETIRKEFNEPRIHFVLVCAAISCPILLNQAYTADKLEQQLQQQGEKFINDPSKNSINTKKANVSQIFNWFGEDFTKQSSLINYLNQFSEIKLDPKATIEFMEYNWDLNE